ncbi:hypothetical protein [Profundibacter sp.]|uniref:hypothetical protein n=1 Tax=Profundibacter sp. TaxID=3101071 RepID=UPI003D15072C
MRAVLAMIALAVLAACGADGEPVRPSVNAGVAVTPSGVHPSVSVGTHVGPINVSIGL